MQILLKINFILEKQEIYRCPHCGTVLKKWLCPQDSSWGIEFQFVCFNDLCKYYVDGWDWMKKQYNSKSSYRYRFNPVNNEFGPLPVWTENTFRSQIIEEDKS